MLFLPEWVVVAALITWLLTALGWLTTNRHANEREARKEYRSALDSLEADVDRLLSAYLTYLTKDAATENEQARILIYSEINRLQRHVDSLEADIGKDLSGKFSLLYEAITGGDFESKARKRVNAGRDHATAAACAEDLVACAEIWFRSAYLRPGIKGFLFRI